MRQEKPANNYAAGTKVDSHRSRAQLGRLLGRYGASEFVVLEHDANATIRFALHGKYVQYILPLPDPDSPAFTHTPTGKPRAFTAQERAYEQAVRQQWRRALLVMKGKLEAVESGLSTFEREFFGAIAEDEKRDRAGAVLLRRKLRWAPESLLLALCLGVFVPASGGLALGLPVTAVDRLASPLWGDQPDPFGEAPREGGSREAVQLSSGGSDAAVMTAASSSDSSAAVVIKRSGSSGGSGAGGSDGGASKGGSGEPAPLPPGSGDAGAGAADGGAGGSGGGNGNTGGGSDAGGGNVGSGGSGGSDGSGGSGGSDPAPPPPPPPSPPDPTPPPTWDGSQQGYGSQGKGNGWDNGNKGNGAGGAAGGKK